MFILKKSKIMVYLQAAFMTALLTFSFFMTSAQKFQYGLNAGFASVKYSFPVEQDRYHTAEIEPFNTMKVGGSFFYALTNAVRIGSGLQFLSIKGKNDGGNIRNRFVNPNGDGRLSFDVDNAFLILPVEFQATLADKYLVKPVISAGLNFFKALDQNIRIHIEPDNPDPYYEEVTSEISDNTPSSYFGARLGGGILLPAGQAHEVYLMIFRNFNKSRYELSDPIQGVFEKHEINFHMWELALGWNFRGGVN